METHMIKLSEMGELDASYITNFQGTAKVGLRSQKLYPFQGPKVE